MFWRDAWGYIRGERGNDPRQERPREHMADRCMHAAVEAYRARHAATANP